MGPRTIASTALSYPPMASRAPTRKPLPRAAGARSARRHTPFLCATLALYAGLCMTFAFTAGDPYYNNDAPRHLLTGAFYADFFRELPLADPVAFAKTYYAHYPALGIVHWPPLFHVILGGAFAVFGVSQGTAAAVMTAFLAIAVVGWFLLTRPLVGTGVAFWSALLFPLAPEFFGLAGSLMLEVPTLAWMILAVLAFDRFLRIDRDNWLWLGVLCAICAALTRPHGLIVLGPLTATWYASRRRDLLRRKAFWAAVLAGALPVGSYYLISTRLDHSNWSMLAHCSAFAWPGLGRPLLLAAGWPILAVSGLGLVWTLARLARREPVPWPLLGWVAATAAMWLALSYRPSRFLVYAWPALVTLGLHALAAAAPRLRTAPHLAGMGLLILCCLNLSPRIQPPLGGYRDAAVAALQATGTNRLFFQGRMDGTFIWLVRQLSPDLDAAVFRASKVLATGEDRLHHNYQPLVEAPDEVIRTLDELGVDVVVTEDVPEMDQPPFHAFRRALDSDRFQRIAVFRLRNAEGRIFARTLTLYRFRRTLPLDHRVALPMASLGPGHDLRADLSCPLRAWNARP
jgi:hypothetical protein